MELNDFKDLLFEMMNGGNTVEDIKTDDINDTFMVSMGDGNTFEIKCKELSFLQITYGKNNRRMRVYDKKDSIKMYQSRKDTIKI